jgi:hypothetical protein
MAINYRTRFAYRIDMWDAEGENIIEHLAGVEDLQVAKATYLAACQRWPGTPITLRQGPRVIEDSRQMRLVWVRRAADKRDELAAFLSHLAGGSSAVIDLPPTIQRMAGSRARRSASFRSSSKPPKHG